MKRKIAGLVLVVMAVAIVVVGFILPQCDEYIPTIGIWETIFEDCFCSTVGLATGISILLIWRITIIKSIAFLLACFFMGLLADLFIFSIFDLFSLPGFLIAISMIGVLITDAIVFLIVGVAFIFSPT